jgi:hypothetical protein
MCTNAPEFCSWQVHGDHVMPVRPAHAVENAVAQDAGIVDENVDAPECFQRRADDLVGILWLDDRERGGDGLSACGFDLGHDFVRRAVVRSHAVERRADIGDDHACALRRHQHRDGAADAAPAAGDDRHFAGHYALGHFLTLVSDSSFRGASEQRESGIHICGAAEYGFRDRHFMAFRNDGVDGYASKKTVSSPPWSRKSNT